MGDGAITGTSTTGTVTGTVTGTPVGTLALLGLFCFCGKFSLCAVGPLTTNISTSVSFSVLSSVLFCVFISLVYRRFASLSSM